MRYICLYSRRKMLFILEIFLMNEYVLDSTRFFYKKKFRLCLLLLVFLDKSNKKWVKFIIMINIYGPIVTISLFSIVTLTICIYNNIYCSQAFGAVEAMTDRICIHSGGKIQVSVSAEDLMSCCGLKCGFGCSGGFPDAAWIYWVQSGIVTGGQYGTNDVRRLAVN